MLQTQSKETLNRSVVSYINTSAFYFDVEKWLDMGRDNTDPTLLSQCSEAGADKNGCLPNDCSVCEVKQRLLAGAKHPETSRPDGLLVRFTSRCFDGLFAAL